MRGTDGKGGAGGGLVAAWTVRRRSRTFPPRSIRPGDALLPSRVPMRHHAPRSLPIARLLAVVLPAVLAGCGGGGDGPTDPPPLPPPSGPSVRIVTGAGVVDTVFARPIQALVAEVRDGAGKLLPNAIIRFEADPPTVAGRGLERAIYVCTVSTPRCGDDPSQIDGGGRVTVDTTDAAGRALVSVRFGTVAGTATVRTVVPELGLSTSAAFTVQPGAAVGIAFAGADTTILIGGALTAAARVVDRFGNVRPEMPELATNVADLQVSGTTITATGLTEGWVVARTGAMADSLRIRAVPAGRLVVWWPPDGTVALVNLDGTDTRTVVSSVGSHYGVFPRFSASGARVVMHRGDLGWGGVPIGIIAADTTGSGRTELAPPGLTQVTQVRGAADGTYLFVARPVATPSRPAPPASLWRATADGATSPIVEIPEYAGGTIGGYGGADLSPDGRRLAYVVGPAGADSPTPLRVLDVETGTVATIAPNGISPRWSPSGDRIAYVVNPRGSSSGGGGRLHVAAADGSGARAIGVRSVSVGIAWSPDGRYLLARSDGEATLRVFEVDGDRTVALRLGVTFGGEFPAFVARDYHQPDWR